MSESEVKRCPDCGGGMDKGYIISDGQLISWSSRKRKFLGKGELLEKVLLTLINLEAYRCARCKLVLFYYGRMTPSETSKSFLKKCVECNKEIPIASEECQYCGAKQKA